MDCNNADPKPFSIGRERQDARWALANAGFRWNKERMLRKDSVFTADFHPKRLNLVLDDNDIVTDCYFG